MRTIVLLALAFGLASAPVEARHRYYYPDPSGYVNSNNGYVDRYGTYHRVYAHNNGYYYQDRKVRSHKRRRNVLLGIGAVGLITGSGAATAIGLGGAVANEVIDRRHRDW